MSSGTCIHKAPRTIPMLKKTIMFYFGARDNSYVIVKTHNISILCVHCADSSITGNKLLAEKPIEADMSI